MCTKKDGTGNDTLYGDPGLDAIRFTAAPLAANTDRVIGFSSIDDRVQLDNAVFTALGATGALPAAMFYRGAAAHDASDRLIYNQTTGALLYDADGTGAVACGTTVGSSKAAVTATLSPEEAAAAAGRRAAATAEPDDDGDEAFVPPEQVW